MRVGCICLLLLVSGLAHSLNPDHLISQYGHRAWRVREGDLPGPAYPIAQTADGYLWIGTQAGLVRFDGAKFTPLTELTAARLPNPFVVSLLATHDGSLWIGTSRGLSRWADQALITYWESPRGVGPLLEDVNGSIWFAPKDALTAGPVCKVVDSSVRCFGKADGIDFPADGCCAGTLLQDAQGSLLISTAVSVLRWTPGGSSASIRAEPKGLVGTHGAMVLAQSPDRTWVGVDSRGEGLGLQQLLGGTIAPFVTPQLDGNKLAVQALMVDHQGVLWIGTLDAGIYRIRDHTVDHFRAADGLSSDTVYWFHEDREGGLWVATAAGIDRFRDLPVTNFSSREGLSVDEADSVLATRDGRVLIGTAERLDVLRPGQPASIKAVDGLPGQQVTSMLEDHAGRIWIGVDKTLSIYADDHFIPVSGMDKGPFGFVYGLSEDAEHNVWAKLANKLVRVRDDHAVDEVLTPKGSIAADTTSGLWLLLRDGTLTRYRHGAIEKMSFEVKASSSRQVYVGEDGAVFGATDGGVVGWKNGVRRTLTSANGLPCDSVNSLVSDREGNLWLFAACGLIEVSAEQLRAWWAQGDSKFRPRLLDALDGVIPGRAPFMGAARAADGRLWFANGVSLQTVDPTKTADSLTMPVHIEAVLADRTRYDSTSPLKLPPNPRDVQIDYTAVNLSTPQRVNFRYRLVGHDRTWQEVGSRRQAFYSDLAPGDYRFQVMAADAAGHWNGPGASVDLKVTAAWYQTLWFRSLAVLLGILGIAVLYRVRVSALENALNTRFDERLAERTRLARELHDTLLQTIQGSKMVADDALDESTDLIGMQRAMTRLSTWLGQAIQEGRAALNALRESTTRTNDLAKSFKHVCEETTLGETWELDFTVTGDSRDMHPIVRDEIFRIGHEAIRNACTHSGGKRLEVSIRYVNGFELIVRDDGHGIEDDVMRRGKDGHFGIRGMQERADRIGGQLTIKTSERSGTTIQLFVPARSMSQIAQGLDAQSSL